MKIAVLGCHASVQGGGWMATKWHLLALRDLGHEVTHLTTMKPHPTILQSWGQEMQGIGLAGYREGVESQYDVVIGIDHFRYFKTLAKRNIIHFFYPQRDEFPPEGFELYSNSNYTKRAVESKFGRPCQTLYIPIDAGFYESPKEQVILHVSRFAKPSSWADKAQRQMVQLFKMISNDLPGWKLVIAGAAELGDEDYFNELMVSGAGYPIEFKPNVTDAEMKDLYAKAAIYWHATGVSLPTIASAQEHLGLAPLEAQASGAVPVVFNSGGIPEVVVQGQTGWLAEDVRQMGKMTLELARNMHIWSSFNQAGRMWAKSWQDYNAFVQRVDQMLKGEPINPLPVYRQEMKYKPEDVTIVIPTLGNEALKRCVDLLVETAPQAKIMVVDNRGEEEPFEFLPKQVVKFQLAHNKGYAGAIRDAEKIATTPLILAFNDDVFATNRGWLEQMLVTMTNDKVAIVGAKLLTQDGRLQHAGGILDMNRDDIGYHHHYMMPDNVSDSQPRVVDFVTGACMLYKRDIVQMPPELAESLNMEEAWMSNVAREKGYATIYQPSAVLYHLEGQTKKRSPESDLKVRQGKEIYRKRWAK